MSSTEFNAAAIAASSVCDLTPYVPGKPLDELEREYGISNAVKLASNENPLGPSAAVIAAVEREAQQLNRYPDGNGYYLKQALSQKLGVAPEQLTLGNGSNDVLVLLAEAFLTPGTSAVFSQYAFVVYPLAVKATGAESIVVPANPAGHPQALGHDLDAMLAAVRDDTRLVFIANPNNPTGTWVEPDALYAFLEALPSHVVAVLDEAYCEYGEDADVRRSLEWLQEFPNLVVTRTFSKIYGLAALRVGYGMSSPEVADLLNRIRQPFNVNSVALAAAQAALDDEGWLNLARELNSAGMAQLEAGLQGLPVTIVPSKGNFLLLDFGRDVADLNEALMREGVIVRPVANYGLPNHLRVSIGTQEENGQLLKALGKVLNS